MRHARAIGTFSLLDAVSVEFFLLPPGCHSCISRAGGDSKGDEERTDLDRTPRTLSALQPDFVTELYRPVS